MQAPTHALDVCEVCEAYQSSAGDVCGAADAAEGETSLAVATLHLAKRVQVPELVDEQPACCSSFQRLHAAGDAAERCK
jgi:hypothetical protein